MELHQKPRSKLSLSDDYETPTQLYKELCFTHAIEPKIDVCANVDNKKCQDFFGVNVDSLLCSWTVDAWVNPPHSMTGKFVEKACNEWKKHNINVMMIIPANTCSSKYWHEFIQPYASYYPIMGRIRFLHEGKLSEHMSRNAYMCVVFRKIITDQSQL